MWREVKRVRGEGGGGRNEGGGGSEGAGGEGTMDGGFQELLGSKVHDLSIQPLKLSIGNGTLCECPMRTQTT